MTIVLSLLAIVFALKLAETTGGLEFDTWGGPFGAALVCWCGGWGISAALGLLLPPDSLGFAAHNFWLSLGIQLGIQSATALVLLLIAWALVPGVHVRRFSGLLIASILIAVFTYAVVAFSPALGDSGKRKVSPASLRAPSP